jgi:hypothetical protein
MPIITNTSIADAKKATQAEQPISTQGEARDNYFIDNENRFVHEIIQDVEPILQQTAEMRSHGFTGSSEMRLAARFPDVVVRNYCNSKGIDMEEFNRDRVHIRNMLKDPALSKFRVWDGKI